VAKQSSKLYGYLFPRGHAPWPGRFELKRDSKGRPPVILTDPVDLDGNCAEGLWLFHSEKSGHAKYIDLEARSPGSGRTGD
jgi:hypothetical protein